MITVVADDDINAARVVNGFRKNIFTLKKVLVHINEVVRCVSGRADEHLLACVRAFGAHSPMRDGVV